MTSRERVLKALNHEEPDRVPIAFGGLESTVHETTHKALREHLGFSDGHETVVDMVQCVVDPDPRLKDLFHTDVLHVWSDPPAGWTLALDASSDSWQDEFGVRWQRPPGGYWYDMADHPLHRGTIEELDATVWLDPRDPTRVAALTDRVRALYQSTDKAIHIGASMGIFEQSFCLRGIENLYMDMAANPLYVEALAERILQWQMAYWENVLDAVGEYVHVVALSDDLGHQRGLLFSPDLFRRIYKPRLRRLVDSIRAKTRARVWLHSCGAIFSLIPDLIEVGIEVLNPVQVAAEGMDSARLKREFGKDLVFWGGGCDPQGVLACGTEEAVRTEVRRRVHDLAPGGGFVFAPIHNVPAGTPPGNIVAMFDAAWEFGQYPAAPASF